MFDLDGPPCIGGVGPGVELGGDGKEPYEVDGCSGEGDCRVSAGERCPGGEGAQGSSLKPGNAGDIRVPCRLELAVELYLSGCG